MRRSCRVLLALALSAAVGACVSDTPEDCAADERFASPGCGEPHEGSEIVDAGCYRECEDAGVTCPDGTVCTQVYIDPCYMAICNACGGDMLLCV